MGIKIGDNNNIKNTNIAEKIQSCPPQSQNTKKSFYEKHPVICSLLISIISGVILLFSFWENIISLIEGWF